MPYVSRATGWDFPRVAKRETIFGMVGGERRFLVGTLLFWMAGCGSRGPTDIGSGESGTLAGVGGGGSGSSGLCSDCAGGAEPSGSGSSGETTGDGGSRGDATNQTSGDTTSPSTGDTSGQSAGGATSGSTTAASGQSTTAASSQSTAATSSQSTADTSSQSTGGASSQTTGDTTSQTTGDSGTVGTGGATSQSIGDSGAVGTGGATSQSAGDTSSESTDDTGTLGTGGASSQSSGDASSQSAGGANATHGTDTGTDAGGGAAGAPSEGECALTELVDLPIGDRVDLVFDEKRCRVYVSTASGVIQSYDIREQTLTPLIDLGDPLVGMDLSPDQDTLLVADENSSPYGVEPRNQVFVIDLVKTRSRTIEFPSAFQEAGTFMPLFIDANTFLLTSRFAGSGWVPLREVDLASGEYTVLADVRQDTMLALSADGSAVALAESNSSNGPVSRYSLADQSFEGVEADWFVYEIAVNRDATQFAVPVYAGLFIYRYSDGFDPEPVELGEYVEHYAIGAVYSPDSDILYVSWTGPGFAENESSIEALDSNTFEPLFTLDDDPEFWTSGNHAFGIGRLRVARSGEMIGATVGTGVRLYPARSAP